MCVCVCFCSACDNCVEFDTSAIVGIAIGNLVATAVVGVAVYLIASVTRTGPAGPPKKKSKVYLSIYVRGEDLN